MTAPGALRDLSPPAAGAKRQVGEARSRRIESLRALAALGVVLGHLYGQGRNAQVVSGSVAQAAPHDGPGVFSLTGGVFVFFALSGYLLFWPFAVQYFGDGHAVDLRHYAANRGLRILPLYYLAVALLLLTQQSGGSLKEWILFPLLLQNYSRDTVGTVDGPMWSLSVEVLFYLVLPVVAAGLARITGRSLSRAAALLVAVAVASYVLRRVKVDPFVLHADQFWEFSPLTTAGFFVPGMLVALLRLHWSRTGIPTGLGRVLGGADGWFVIAMLLWVVYSASPRLEFVSEFASAFLIGACVLGLDGGSLVRVLDWRPLAALGVASYSLYLWHDPLISSIVSVDAVPDTFLALVLVCLPICIAVATVSYLVVERPFLRWRRRWS